MNRMCAALLVSAALSVTAPPAASSADTRPGGHDRDLGGRVTYLVPPRNRALVDGVLSGDGNGRLVAAWSTGKTTSVRWRGRHGRWSHAVRFAAGDGLQQQQATFAEGSPLVVWTSETITPRCASGEETCAVYVRSSTRTARGWSHPHTLVAEEPYDSYDLISNTFGDAALVSSQGVNFFTNGQWDTNGTDTDTGYGSFLSGASALDSRGRAVVVRWAWNGGQKFLQIERVSPDFTSQTWPFPTNSAERLGLPSLGTDKTGDVELVWRTWGGSGVTVWTSTLSDSGDLSAPEPIIEYPSSLAAASEQDSCTALAGDGRAVFAWPSGHGVHGVHAAYRNATGHLGAVTSFAAKDPGCSSVAFPKSGGAWMLFHMDVCGTRGHSCSVRYRVARHPASGSWAAPRTVASHGLKPTGTTLTGPDGHLTFPLFRRGSYFAALTTTVP